MALVATTLCVFLILTIFDLKILIDRIFFKLRDSRIYLLSF